MTELGVVFGLTPLPSLLNRLDTIAVVCSLVFNISDVDFVDVGAEFGSVSVFIPELVSLVELGVVF
jgi:hypothetical protein